MYRLGDLDTAQSVIEDLGEWVPEIPYDVFVHHLLPKVTGFDPSATVEALKVAGSLILDQERDVWSWSAFKSEPKDSAFCESVAFKPLEIVHEQICRKAFPGKTTQPIPNTEYFVCGDSTLTSGADGMRTANPSRPDGYGYLKRHKEEYLHFGELAAHIAPQEKDDWYNVVHVEEYKKASSKINQDDVRKPMWWQGSFTFFV